MKALSLYKKKYCVEYGDSDYYKSLKLSSLFNYIQYVASLHSKNLGAGIDDIEKEHGLAWVMVRILLNIDRMPVWNEEIYIETWPVEPKKMEFERDFCVRDKEGKALIKAISSWVLLDIDKREIVKSESVNIDFPPFIGERAVNKRMSKIKSNGELMFVYSRKISYSDIDINGHLNNSRYIDFIADCFPIDKHCMYAVEEMQVNYINEALAGDTIALYKDISQFDTGNIYVEGVNEERDKVFFKACIKLRRLYE
ncbi:acyl-ACP thioesterase [Ruminiclostridium sufflavum DSM 19573]|uniref:Acyl-ACP thioesterase n=1 Tax=Ruminiclostridium sufflavum DSM 19573 TaxID=1121337 RepID=A0A318XRK9_9FIRM|nr:acyl-ACP thioesterase domain-containing protein [Ruminiclostridium sufflavum]PYG90299.1 acyl-ACP thioesterase [Ruminiclostridium sufflavum DSM 19573]